MNELFGNAKKAITSLINDEELEKQLLSNQQQIEKLNGLFDDYSKKMANIGEKIQELETNVKKLNKVMDAVVREMKTIITWQLKVEDAAQYVAGIQPTTVQPTQQQNVSAESKVPPQEGMKPTVKKEEWPVIYYADSFSSFSPYGFTPSDFQSEYMGQLYAIKQISSTEAYFTLNKELESQQILSNYKYGLKSICDELERNDTPSRIVVTEPGHLMLTNNIWTIKKKLSIKLL